MPIETVFLDAGGVLVNPNWVRVAEALRRHGVEADAGRLARAEPRAKRRLDAPEPIQSSSDAARGWLYFDLVLEGAGIARSDRTDAALQELQGYHAEWNLWESVPEDVPGALDLMREAGLRLVVVSNANGTVEASFARLGLRERFDVVVDSFHEGVEKPDPAIFERALARAGAKRETTMHAGDFYHVDVVGARAAGLQAWLVDVAGVNADRDCPRVASVAELARRVLAGTE